MMVDQAFDVARWGWADRRSRKEGHSRAQQAGVQGQEIDLGTANLRP